MVKEKSVLNGQGGGMQDDQTKPAGSAVKNEDVSSDISGLSLGGSPPPDDSSVADPAQEAMEQKQSEQPSDTAPTSSKEIPPAPAVEGEPPTPPSDAPAIETAAPASQGDSSSTLDPIKKEALQKLEPLVNELDLHPEEKYRALMMIIQATDNKELVNEAYQAADKIEDNKTRAQALLSIVNEIEYFKNKEIASSNQ